MKLTTLIIIFVGAVNGAKILGVFFIPSISHQFNYHAIIRELVLRGHEVTFITTNPIRDPKLINLTEVDISIAYKMFEKFDFATLNRHSMNLFSMVLRCQEHFRNMIASEMDVEEVKNILNQPENIYDLILMEDGAPFYRGLGHKFKAPMVVVSPVSLNIFTHKEMGNPIHPVLYPDWFSTYTGPVTNIWKKFDSLYVELVFFIMSELYTIPRSDRMARKYFGNDMPYIKTLMKETSFVIALANPLVSDRRPLVPNVIEVWNTHGNRSEVLSGDLKNILDDAVDGVVYFSLGTNVRFEYLEKNWKQKILQELGKLPYTVLCKWESDDHPDRPQNVILRKWFPQQSILGHPNVKVFVTQGGQYSMEDAISNGVPMVVVPFHNDQFVVAQHLTSRGAAETISSESIDFDKLRDTILKVSKNDSYRLKAQELQKILLDKPRPAHEEVAWWCEYIIRHKGAKHLRSPSADIPLYEWLMLDMLAVFIAIVFIIYKLLRKLLQIFIGIFRKEEPKTKKME
ncbi:hypothetical protein HHI36_003386 [Cryptolaemus montrouzieri]|uniref:UDP-glucuronosyltransferase n=1 Tax=Cryptolaemus montrouzieri TaxID=559131 RepID=A0ABD2PDZ7_9CUCU